ncbi:protein NLP1-like [Zingiber officinale]|uniref:protein NLP1-like n=1 Tax=Zingiber officinale TaxID=94328 RepID=UPI001C4D4E7C|nr:protein NLP1-like [Zingiber officinale]XP_042391005.1 protein NLP1-like [Zingiber officinale]
MDAVPESSPARNLSDGAADLDFLDQFFSGDGWLEFPEFLDEFQSDTPKSISPFNPMSFSPLFEVNDNNPNPGMLETCYREGIGKPDASTCLPGDEYMNENLSSETRTSWQIQPGASSFSVEEKIVRVLDHFKEIQRDGEVLVQLWVPVKRGDQMFLTTYGQPFSLDPNCERLVNYRQVSTSYQFSAEESSGKALGLPGRVFIGRLPEWTPDVRYFNSYEYPRVDYAQRFGIRGSIGIPVFDHGRRSCLGVVEVIMTTQKINYTFELEKICNALQEVDLSSSSTVIVPQIKVSSDSYQAAVSEILEVLKTVCKIHMLPLAQTWVLCTQQGKKGFRHSDENYRECVSTADAACYVNDPSMIDFYEACSEYHLLKGQGIVGRAFITNQPCFFPDVTTFSKTEYPLVHHAKLFGLKGAVAIRLRSILTGNADFVLEFFLPTNCLLIEDQKLMLASLSRTMQHVCQNLRVVTNKELADDSTLWVNKMIPPNFLMESSSPEAEPGKIDHTVTTIEGQITRMSRDVAPLSNTEGGLKKKTSQDDHKDEIERFGIIRDRDDVEVISNALNISSMHKQHPVDMGKDDSDNENSMNFGSSSNPVVAKTTAKRHRKPEKNVSLEVLQKYFSGSLKDAAKSVGVCPTTLKRICRQHGITRWPSRKIKKVDHSLKKLQVVIDSVHGADKAIQLSSLYKNFTTVPISEKNSSGDSQDRNSSGDFPVSKSIQHDCPNTNQDVDARSSHHHSSSSHSSCSQTSTPSLSSPGGEQHCIQIANPGMKQEENHEKISGIPQGANREMDLHLSSQSTWIYPNEFQSHKSLGEHYSSLEPTGNLKSNWMIVKATYGEEKVRIRLDPSWNFEKLRHEILKRFNIVVENSVNLHYVDDESEWVLLTCDADLQECIHIYRLSDVQTIKISVQEIGTHGP